MLNGSYLYECKLNLFILFHINYLGFTLLTALAFSAGCSWLVDSDDV